ncbi:hypothetical protein QBC34DRAFT_40407 [Podospora aff. communis PSN243]|uniref:Uncharacterized protein n=1 Tax=Podospora aff. communis PSN243 TaxID=3040156 RepID=A0AAV9GW32_9PEZI|nr:hypothetical protein QBC34DRAFT_40407 [Podospora aff. communis PSN243]
MQMGLAELILDSTNICICCSTILASVRPASTLTVPVWSAIFQALPQMTLRQLPSNSRLPGIKILPANIDATVCVVPRQDGAMSAGTKESDMYTMRGKRNQKIGGELCDQVEVVHEDDESVLDPLLNALCFGCKNTDSASTDDPSSGRQ